MSSYVNFQKSLTISFAIILFKFAVEKLVSGKSVLEVNIMRYSGIQLIRCRVTLRNKINNNVVYSTDSDERYIGFLNTSIIGIANEMQPDEDDSVLPVSIKVALVGMMFTFAVSFCIYKYSEENNVKRHKK